jgi:hypothetical protein
MDQALHAFDTLKRCTFNNLQKARQGGGLSLIYSNQLRYEIRSVSYDLFLERARDA